MKHRELQTTLQETGAYTTRPDRKVFWLDRLFGWSDFWFYLRQTLIFFSGNLSARRGDFGREGWYVRACQILELIENVGGRIEISGVNHMLALQEPAVFTANHMSMMETMLLPGAIILPFRSLTTVVKESLTRYPLFGRIMRDLDPITVGRRTPREDLRAVLEKGTRSLQRGVSVILFPQSTRAAYFAPAEFNSLGAKLAKRAGAPLIPVALKTDFQGVGRIRAIRDFGPLDRSKPIYFKFGPPLRVQGDGHETHEQVVAFIADQLREWGVEIRGDAKKVEASRYFGCGRSKSRLYSKIHHAS
ncbi:MAG: lysophospholipid acyltransferase family protein [Verrucomicrobiota bacterium]|nr:lysophospholipid acyltransferase family protein [Verrucomicrobiota bacterium]